MGKEDCGGVGVERGGCNKVMPRREREVLNFDSGRAGRVELDLAVFSEMTDKTSVPFIL